MGSIHITDIESAINHWRDRDPERGDFTLAAPTLALAEVYGLMVFEQRDEVDEASLSKTAFAAWQAWYETTPDTPCIAICSTSQGDDVCKGCGRSFIEVQMWTQMTPVQKRQTWRRITQDHDAWRFNRYAERALGSGESWVNLMSKRITP